MDTVADLNIFAEAHNLEKQIKCQKASCPVSAIKEVCRKYFTYTSKHHTIDSFRIMTPSFLSDIVQL